MSEYSSVTVSKLALRYLNTVAGLLQFKQGRSVPLTEALLRVCAIADYDFQQHAGWIAKDKDFQAFERERFAQLEQQLAAEEERTRAEVANAENLPPATSARRRP